MKPEPTRDELREMLGAYALNALDPEERAQVDALLLSDADARAELHELEHAAAWLGHASLRPPVRAWDAIAAEVARDLTEDAAPSGPAPAAPVPMRRTGANWGARWLVAAAVAVVALGGAAGVVALADRTSAPDTVAEQAREASRDADAVRATLTSTDGRWSARVVVLPDRTGYLHPEAMPENAPDRDLQLWSITPSGPVSAGVVRGGGEWHEFRVHDAATAIAVTSEPRGGSREPTGAPIVTGEIRA
jgi:hypothetical protein